ncbi:hypothetical protein PRELSG_0002600 [Plasmodium relictum]|uniref:Uncharacterized protein n=1 Tax=Plasmodium relictum TaxID=85471 RepID=A0A1J1GK28_PLARL|nr:hypothetical protein PRELSG_0002600 [Plasmodium relictum]CRG84625.1 hypothetical protein PRELSG_0002600 [Plasmodium relictum]
MISNICISENPMEDGLFSLQIKTHDTPETRNYEQSMKLDKNVENEVHIVESEFKIPSFNSKYFFDRSQDFLNNSLLELPVLEVSNNEEKENVNTFTERNKKKNIEEQVKNQIDFKKKIYEIDCHSGQSNEMRLNSKIIKKNINYQKENREIHEKEYVKTENFLDNFFLDLSQNNCDLNNATVEEENLESPMCIQVKQNVISYDLQYHSLNPIENSEKYDDDMQSVSNILKRKDQTLVGKIPEKEKFSKKDCNEESDSSQNMKFSNYTFYKQGACDYEENNLKSFAKIIAEDIFKLELDYVSYDIFINLPIILDSLKSNYNSILKEYNEGAQSLILLIDEELKNNGLDILQEIENLCNNILKNSNKSLLDTYYNILLFKSNANVILNKKLEIVTSIKKSSVLWKKLLEQLDIVAGITRILSRITNNFTYTDILNNNLIYSDEGLNLFQKLFNHMNEFIRSLIESVRNGFLLNNNSKIENVKNSLFIINNRIRKVLGKYSDKCLYLFKMMKLSKADNIALIDYIFYKINEENEKPKKYIEGIMGKYNYKNTTKIVHNFFLKEEKRISDYKNYAFTFYNLSVSGEIFGNKCLQDIINDSNASEMLQFIYNNMRKFIGLSTISKQVKEIKNIFCRLKEMEFFLNNKVILQTEQILEDTSQLNLSSNIEIQKDIFKEIKLGIESFFSLKTLQTSILEVNEIILGGKSELETIVSSFNTVELIFWDDEYNVKYPNGKKKVEDCNILFSLFYIKNFMELHNIKEIS